MAVSKLGMLDARTAGEDLSEKLYYAVVLGTAGEVFLAGDGELAYGIVAESAASGNPVTVQLDGLAKVIYGGTVLAGAKVGVDANGKIVTATSSEFIIGIARVDGVANDIGTIDLRSAGATV